MDAPQIRDEDRVCSRESEMRDESVPVCAVPGRRKGDYAGHPGRAASRTSDDAKTRGETDGRIHGEYSR